MAKVKNMFKFFRNAVEFSDWTRTDEKLLKAVEAYDISKVVSILNKKATSTTKCGPKGYAALHYVCVKGYEDLVDLFLAHGADVNVVNERGNTALHLASHNGFENIVSKLLMAGAKIDSQNPYQMTALHVACNGKHENVVHVLVENETDINARDKTQKTPLFFSCYHGHLGICEYLVEKGAVINMEDISRVTPLLTAVRQNHLDISKFLLEKGADPYVKDRFDVSAVKAGQESNSQEMRKLFSKLPLTSSEAKSNSTSEVCLQREISADLSVQVIDNLSFGEDLKSEMVVVQLRQASSMKDTVNNERRPLSAPPAPPPRNKFAVSSVSENIEDWELVEGFQLSSENTESTELIDSLHSVSENMKDKESVDSLNVFPSDNADSNEASFLGLPLEEHRSRLSSLSKSDIQNKWDQQKDEDVISNVSSNTSQHSDETRSANYDHDFSFIPGNATPRMGRNISLRRQILMLRQENNQLRETIQENQDKIQDQEEEISHLENSLSEEKKKNLNLSLEDSEVLSEDGNDTKKQVTKNAEENEASLNERLSKLMEENKQFMVSLELPNQSLEQETRDKKVTNLLQENLNLMQNLEQLTRKISFDFATEPKEELEEVTNQQDDMQVIQELKDLKEQHVHLQSDYNNLASTRDKLQEEYDELQEGSDKLIVTLRRLKLDNEQATKQNCNLLNMKDNLQQEVEEMIEQQKNLQEKYNLLFKKTEFLEKTVEELSASEDVRELSLSHFDETENLLHAVEAEEAWEDDNNDQELKVLQLDNSLLEEQCRKLLLEKDILEEANADLKEAQDAIVKLLNSEKEELQAEKVELAEKLEEVTKETCIMQQEMHFLKCQVENTQSTVATQNAFNHVSNSETGMETNSKIQMLENEITGLQQQLMQTEKKHEEIVQNYRLHLISAIQGYVDPDVEKALYSIIELRRLEFYC